MANFEVVMNIYQHLFYAKIAAGHVILYII